MRADWSHLDHFRRCLPDGRLMSKPGERFGLFVFTQGTSQLRCMVDDGRNPYLTPEEAGWEHVSISVATHKGTRCPTWGEMCFVKDQFWDEEECVVQYHPPRADYVNYHPHTLHLFKPLKSELPRPPSILVGEKS